jgi:energy-coupling factor transporter ATP-binding protein EcfA2
MSDTELSTQEKSKIRAALIKAGQTTRGLNSADMLAAYRKHCGIQIPQANPAMPMGATPVGFDDGLPLIPEEVARTKPTPTETQEMALPTPQNTALLAEQLAKMLTATQQPAPQLDEAQLIKLIKQHAAKNLHITAGADRGVVKIEGAHHQLEQVIVWASTGTNIYLTGPAGSGKTTLAEQTATALSLPFYSSGAIMASYELLGVRTAHGDYIPTGLRTAYEKGGVFLLDEVDGCSAKALVCFNQLLANHSFTFPDGMVEKHADFVAIAGANTTGQGATRQYIGRSQLDAATLDRFIQIEVTYDEELESRLAHAEYEAHGGSDKKTIEKWVSKVQNLRAKLLDMKATALVTPRASMFGARGLAKNIPLESLIEQVLTKHLTEDQKAQVGRI